MPRVFLALLGVLSAIKWERDALIGRVAMGRYEQELEQLLRPYTRAGSVFGEPGCPKRLRPSNFSTERAVRMPGGGASCADGGCIQLVGRNTPRRR